MGKGIAATGAASAAAIASLDSIRRSNNRSVQFKEEKKNLNEQSNELYK